MTTQFEIIVAIILGIIYIWIDVVKFRRKRKDIQGVDESDTCKSNCAECMACYTKNR